MPLSRYEQEVQINFNAESADAELYAASPAWIRKMDKLAQEHPETFKVISQERSEGKTVSKTYLFPKGLISIRAQFRKRILTDEEKKQRAENLKRARLHQNGGK